MITILSCFTMYVECKKVQKQGSDRLYARRFIISTTAVFIACRHHDTIKVHGISLIVAQACCVVLGSPLSILHMAFYPWYPCAASLLSLTMIINWDICLVGRVIHLRETFDFHRRLVTQYSKFRRLAEGGLANNHAKTKLTKFPFRRSTNVSDHHPLGDGNSSRSSKCSMEFDGQQ
ncbi:hypothetical protein BJ742DRAFT_800845 [Cladochytrium replicatum]|nr:hypothetical protein BJ742DRAFT_800845 [Cladochytrium replicatum]